MSDGAVAAPPAASARPASPLLRVWRPATWVALLLATTAVLALAWPIAPQDGDLWYHLTSGRYIARHHALPRQAFFSVLPASPRWADYYWLFQVVV